MANDNRPMITDPNALAHLVQAHGGTVVAGRTFQFDLALGAVREVVPKLAEVTGLGIRKVGERVAEDPIRLGKNETVTTLEFYRK